MCVLLVNLTTLFAMMGALQTTVNHLDRVLADCTNPVSRGFTMLLAGYLAKEVAAILREILAHPTKKLYDDTTPLMLVAAHLPGTVAFIITIKCHWKW